MGLFGGKDWNVIAVIFEKKDLYRVNGNRAKGNEAVKARDGAKSHPRTLYYAVFDQKRSFLEGDVGKGLNQVPLDVLDRLKRELGTNATVLTILRLLEKGETNMAAKPLAWDGYPKPDVHPGDPEYD